MRIKRLLAILLSLFLCVITGQAVVPQVTCISSTNTWKSTQFNVQTKNFCSTPFTITPTIKPAVGSGGPIMGISSAAATGYPQNSALIRQSENGYWEAYNQTTGVYGHDIAVQWAVSSSATMTMCFDFNNQSYSVQITQPNSSCSGSCTLASAYKFRTPATSLGFWNFDDSNGALTVCNFGVATPVPQIGGLNPTSGAVGSQVQVSGSNFGATQGNSTVSFGGVTATSVQAWNDTAISATVPNTAQTGNVIVTVSNQVSNGMAFTVVTTPPPLPPQVTSIGVTVGVSISCGLTQPPPASHVVVLSWTASNSSGVTAYNIYRSSVSGSGYLKIGSATTLTYSDPNLASGSTYYYVVTAVAGALESVWSNQTSATIP